MDERIFTALQFAARKHVLQRRKGGHDIPYINHPIDVAHQLATCARVTDAEVLCAALLHDTVEDTDTTPEELERTFGPAIASLVAEVTDEAGLESSARKERQVQEAARKSPRAKLIRLADKTCNVRDITRNPPASWSLERRSAYFAWAERVVKALGPVNADLEREFADALAAARASIGESGAT